MSGIFGIVTKGDCSDTILYAVDYHSHLGTEYGGIATLEKDFFRQIHNIGQSQFKSKFFDDCKLMKGNKGIGVISDMDEQPIYLHSKFGPFCLVTNGIIENSDELSKKLFASGISFSEVSKGVVNNTELAAKLITQGDNIVDGIKKMLSLIEGSISLLLLNKDGVYAARDRFGYSPLIIGKGDDGYALTTETTAFPNIGFKPVRNISPGEIVLIHEKGITQKYAGDSKTNQICTFLWIYTGFPASSYDNINSEVVRERCGRLLAKKDNGLKADMIAGVPDSGIAHAIGYAMESGIPLRRPLVKYTPGYGRSYTPPTQDKRNLVAKMKLIPINEIIKGNRIILCEDSIVRGTQLKNFTVNKLWEGGAKEVHVRPACPPLMFPCKFNLSTRTVNELATRKAIRSIEGFDPEDISEYIDHKSPKNKEMVDWIARDLEVTSLSFQTVDDLVKAVGLPKEKLCLYCWTGKCPKRNTSPKTNKIRSGKKKK